MWVTSALCWAEPELLSSEEKQMKQKQRLVKSLTKTWQKSILIDLIKEKAPKEIPLKWIFVSTKSQVNMSFGKKTFFPHKSSYLLFFLSKKCLEKKQHIFPFFLYIFMENNK